MLHFVLGADGTGKTEYLRSFSLKRAKETEVLFIVPEQFSFSCEKYFYERQGSEKISVMSFGKVEKKIFSALGGTALPFMNAGEKNIMMYRAVSECGDLLNALSGISHRPETVGKLCSFSDMLRSFSVSPSDFYKSASALSLVTENKAKDISLILDTFDALCEGKYYQESGSLDAAVNKLRTGGKDLFPDVIIFDEFWFYTGEQQNLIEEFLREGKEVYVSLPLPNAGPADKYDVFSYPDRTRAYLSAAARDIGVGYDETVLCEDMRHRSPDMKSLKDTYMGVKCENVTSGDITVTECPDSWSETALAAARINDLVMNGYKYGEIAVCVPNGGEYREVIEETFGKYGIPYFDDNLRPISESPITAFAVTVLSLCRKGDTDMYMSAAKSGYINITEYETELLESYVTMWNIKGNELEKPLTESPFGFDFNQRHTEEEKKNELEKINKIRLKVVMPVIEMRKSLSQSPTGGEITRALYECLWKEYKINERLSSMFSQEGNDKFSHNAETAFNAFSDMLDKIYNTLENTPISIGNYKELMYLYASSVKIGKVPTVRDSVVVGTPERMRTDGDIKVLFLIGTCDGVFPGGTVSSDIFSKKEKNELKENGLKFIKCEEDVYSENLFTVYKTLLRPSEKLYVSYPAVLLSGTATAKSRVIPDLIGRLGIKTEKYDDIDRAVFIKSPGGAFSEMARTFTMNTPFSAALKKYFSDNGKKDMVNRLSAGRLIAEDRVEDKELLRNLYPDVIKLSASKADVFFQCRFKYFCNYVLNLEPRREARLAPAESGILIHYILQKIIEKLSLGETGKDSVKDDIEKIFSECSERFFGSADTKSVRFLRAYDKLKRMVRRLGDRLVAELSECEFVPADFELDIASGEKNEPLTFTTASGKTVEIKGSIDRVDLLCKNGKEYVRVIDYKSGRKEFRLSEINEGINMQMLIYLMALRIGGKDRYKNVYPAGVLYVPARDPSLPEGRNLSDDDIRDRIQSGSRMKGILLSDEEVLRAMDKDMKGKFIPVKISKDGTVSSDSLVTLSQFGKIQMKITDNLKEMAEALTEGDPTVNPIDISDMGVIKACKYCDYKSVCGNFDGENTRAHTDKSNEEYLLDLEEEYGMDE